MATPAIAQAGIAYVPESMAVFSDLTVRENLYLAARSGALQVQEHLAPHAVHALSSGEISVRLEGSP